MASGSKQAFEIKCNATIEVWVWENSPPHDGPHRFNSWQGRSEKGPAGCECSHITTKLYEKVLLWTVADFMRKPNNWGKKNKLKLVVGLLETSSDHMKL